MLPAALPVFMVATAMAQSRDHRSLRVVLPDRTIVASISQKRHRGGFDEGRRYYWCQGQHVHVTQGGAEGELLDGPYLEFHPDGQLMTKGMLRCGVKDGVWYEWSADGTIRVLSHWERGYKHGEERTYVEADSIHTVHYKHGKLLPARHKKERQERSNRRRGASVIKPDNIPANGAVPDEAIDKPSRKRRGRNHRPAKTNEQAAEQKTQEDPKKYPER